MSQRVLTLAILCASASAFAVGTPFFRGERGYEFHDRSITGIATDDGLLLGFPHGDRVRWGTAGAAVWSVEPLIAVDGTLQDLRFGVHRDPVPLFSAVAVDLGYSGYRLTLRRQDDALESEIELTGASEARFFYEGARSVKIEGDGAELVVALDNGLLHERQLSCFERSSTSLAPVRCRFDRLQQVDEGRFEYSVVAERRDLFATLVIDPTFIWTDTFGGLWREYSPFMARSTPTSDAITFIAETTSGLEGWTPSGSYGTPLQDGGNFTFDNRSDFILGERAGRDAGEAVAFILVGGDGADSPRAFAHNVPPLPASCTAGITTSSLTSLAGTNSVVRTAGPVNDGGLSNGFIWCRNPTQMASQYLVFGGSGTDEALGFFPITGQGLKFIIVGRTNSTDLTLSCTGTPTCRPPHANTSALLGSIDFITPTQAEFATYPRDGREGRFTAAVERGGQFYAAGLFPSATDDAGFLEVAYFFSTGQPAAQRESLQSSRFFIFTAPLMAMTSDGGQLYVAGSAYSGVQGGGTIVEPYHPGSSPIDSFVTRMDLTGSTIRTEWTTHIGGNLTETALALAVTKESDVLAGGYTTSPTNSSWSPLGQSPLKTLPGTATHLWISQLRQDGQPRYRHFYGGPFGQDQVRSFLYLPRALGPTIDKLWIGLGLQSTYGYDAGTLPRPPPFTTPKLERELGFSLVSIDTTLPSATILPDTAPNAAASFTYSAVNSGPSGVRSVTASLRGLDGGAPLQSVTTFVDGGTTFLSRFIYPGPPIYTTYRAEVHAITEDGFETTIQSTFTTSGDGGVVLEPDGGSPTDGGELTDGGTTEPVDSGTPTTGPKGLSPMGFGCNVADGSLLFAVLLLACSLLSRRPARRI